MGTTVEIGTTVVFFAVRGDPVSPVVSGQLRLWSASGNAEEEKA